MTDIERHHAGAQVPTPGLVAERSGGAEVRLRAGAVGKFAVWPRMRAVARAVRAHCDVVTVSVGNVDGSTFAACVALAA